MSASLVVYADGSMDEMVLPEPNDDGATLAAMYWVLDCDTVDVVRLDGTIDMWVDDDGIGKGLPVNSLATKLARGYGLTHQPYFGTALLCSADENGSSRNLTDEQASALRKQLEILKSW